ncbi:MAG: sulfur carrier protein ThiS [Bacteroidales bacterium]|nr:sulfur carrier protein ThiS [Bacteroidales bacterium]
MNIILNNREEFIEASEITLQQLVDLKNFTFRMLVTKVNDRLVKKEDRDGYPIRDGDKVTVLHLVSGG